MHKNPICGIYRITSPSGNFYVGSSTYVQHRRSHHLASLRKGKHHSAPLQRAANRYGHENLTFEVLCECPREDLRELEQLVIDMVRPRYNATLDTRTPLDHLWGQEWFREKMVARSKETFKNQWADPAFRAMRAEVSRRVGKQVASRPELVAARTAAASVALIELWKTPEHRQKMFKSMSDQAKARWEKPEFREKMASISSERGKKGAAAMLSKPENRAKLRQFGLSNVHNTHTPEARAKNKAGIRAAIGRKVRCVETGQVFETIKDAAKAVGAKPQNISAAVNGKVRSSAGFTWRFC